jgi:hypothetical protein
LLLAVCLDLLAVCLDQALDELVDVARLGQLPFGQLAAQLGLGQALVALAGPVMSLPGLPALGEAASRACSFSACSACSRAVRSADSARSRTIWLGRFHLAPA